MLPAKQPTLPLRYRRRAVAGIIYAWSQNAPDGRILGIRRRQPASMWWHAADLAATPIVDQDAAMTLCGNAFAHVNKSRPQRCTGLWFPNLVPASARARVSGSLVCSEEVLGRYGYGRHEASVVFAARVWVSWTTTCALAAHYPLMDSIRCRLGNELVPVQVPNIRVQSKICVPFPCLQNPPTAYDGVGQT